ncbi:hypothetical protein TNCV_3052371 [Trichonephila clavipes]|nr:hypothetical protein TNCV_3052371 [Trichonephila clavipes]
MARLQFVDTAGGVEEYCAQMMVVSPIVWQLHEHCWSLKLLRTQSLPFRQQCRVHVSFKHGRPACARSSNFPVSSKRLTSFKRPAGVKGPFPLFNFSELGIYARQWSLIPRLRKIIHQQSFIRRTEHPCSHSLFVIEMNDSLRAKVFITV